MNTPNSLEKPVYVLGFTGHISFSRIKNFNEERMRGEISRHIKRLQQRYRVKAYCGCAEGFDLLFAEEALNCNAELTVVLPCVLQEFLAEHSDGGVKFMQVFNKANEVLIKTNAEHRYVGVSETIVGACNELVAVWDGIELPLADAQGKAINLGGTYDTVRRAKAANKRVKLL